MLLTEDIREACNKCRRMAMPFAVVVMPSDSVARFFCDDKVVDLTDGTPTGWEGFVVGRFGKGTEQSPLGIAENYSVEDILNFNVSDTAADAYDELTAPESTDKEQYLESIASVVASLDHETEKVVISRAIVLESDNDPMNVAEKYFSELPDCFRAIYYTPSTGMWITCTPETLFRNNRKDNSLTTMSLAGTRPVALHNQPWDHKNSCEHRLVTDYILNTLTDNGLHAEITAEKSLQFGDIEHLCHEISATGKIDEIRLAMKLSPTPAVCGWPVEKALDTISRHEHHRRGCYGGFLGVVNGKDCNLFVNLRCCRVFMTGDHSYTYELFAGGGINSMSSPEAEWDETIRKSRILKNIVTEKSQVFETISK